MRFPISDQYQPWPYFALFSHNSLLLGDKVSKWCIKVGGDDTMSTLARQHKMSGFLCF